MILGALKRINLPSRSTLKLSWKDPIAYISWKIARGIGIILKAWKHLLKESLITSYYSFIYQYMIYCNHVWGWACKPHLGYLIKLQKRVIRIIAGVHPRIHTEPLFWKLNLLKCEDTNKHWLAASLFAFIPKKRPFFQKLLQGTGMHILMILVKRINSIPTI